MGNAKHHHHNRSILLPFLFSVLIFHLSISPSSSASSTFQDDISTMQKMAGLLSPAPQGWSTTTDPCGTAPKWRGVDCSSGRVVAINLASSSIEGSLPSDLNKLTALKSLSLQKNSLSGPLPTLADLTNLQQIFLDSNMFTSIPPTFFSGLSSLQVVSLDDNPLSPWSIPDDLSGSTSLASFFASNASVVGSIPDFFGTLPNLQSLRLSYNNITGGLPSTLASSGIMNLWLNNQQSAMKLSGPIDVLRSMTQLSQVWLQTNAFTGPVPDLSNCTSIFDLQLRDNRLTGVLPASIFALPALVNVSLGNNMLQGPFPSFSSDVQVDKSLANNNFCNGQAGPCDLRVVTLLEVEAGFGYPGTLADSWKGNDPCDGWSFVSCDPQGNVIVLSLAKQQLVGSISPALANITSLRTLLLSNNNLTGPIPDGLAGLPQLQTVDVSNNNLSGKVPAFGKSVKLTTAGNPLLGTDPPPSGGSADSGGSGSGSSSGSSPNQSPTGRSTSSMSAGKIAGIVLGVILLGLIVAVLVRACLKRLKSGQGKSSLNEPEMMKLTATGTNGNGLAMSELNSLNSSGHSNANVFEVGSMVISINDLRLATNNFSEDNIVGKGGFGVVYKGVLRDGSQVAVKRMESGVISSKGLNEFQAEIAVLTKVRHRHLVGLKGYCTDGNEKLLVYEYMPKGTLGQHLFEWESLEYDVLSWMQRLTIALDVARGIEYLHSLAHQSFIHRDLKPSNILLGDDMRAKVSDFGLVKLAPDGKYSMETRLAGTFGYLAPEYAATGKVTTKADVYSFGVVLMEMITGRKVLDDSKPEEQINLVTWFRRVLISKGNNIRDILDPNLKPDEEMFNSIVTVAELAGHCTAREPYQRPEMGHVVNILSPMVEQWKPASPVDDNDGYGADLPMDLGEALKRWQANEGTSMMGGTTYGHTIILGDTESSIGTKPDGIPEKFNDGR